MSTHAGTEPPLVETKLAPARVRPEHLHRERLLAELDRLAPTSLTLVDAPVGFGKTVLVQSWCERTSDAVAWVALDASDDDPARLWTYVATAVDRIRPGLGRMALSRLHTPGVPTDAAVDELVNGLVAYGETITLVFDDLHLAGDACYASIDRALDRLPANARLVATTRVDPPFRLARFRAQGLLGEIRARELAFTLDEAVELLIGHEGIELDTSDVELLVERTEGWPAGLYLAALWLRTLDDPRRGVSEFHGSHRHVADYLSSEVLDTLDARTRDFLVRTSVLERFTATLCDAVLETQGSAELVDELAQSNLFLVPLDPRGEWFRYHHLFGELLQLELADIDARAAARLHRRAYDWCREQGLVEDALIHASAAGDDRAVAELLHDHYGPLIRNGRHATYLRWTRSLSDELLVERPILASAAALAARLEGLSNERLRYRHLAERARDANPKEWTVDAEVALEMASIGWIDVELPEALERAERIAELATRGRSEFAVPALAGGALAWFLAGDLDAADRYARQAVDHEELPLRPHGAVAALSLLSLVDAAEGRVADAEKHARAALAEASRTGIRDTPSAGYAHVALAVSLEASGRLRDAEREAVLGERYRESAVPELTHAHALLVLARIRARLGRMLEAEAVLAAARRILSAFGDAGVLGDLAREVESVLDGARGRAEDAITSPSDAELSVLRLLSTDLSQREIGARLFLSLNTVKTHTRVLYRKLGVTSRHEAVARANALGLIGDGDSPR